PRRAQVRAKKGVRTRFAKLPGSTSQPGSAKRVLTPFFEVNGMEYQVELESFRGPLDLLLYLVKREEVDICDIPIAKIAEQFLEHLKAPPLIDVEWAGEFLVMAATLMEIKSKMLLPRPEEGSGEDADPRLELVRQLVEYKKFKDAAALL